MALVQGEFYSEALGMDTQITALIPEPPAACKAAASGQHFPALYILHGATGTQMDVVLQTELAEMVCTHFPNLAVIMPSGNFSFWTDYQEEYRYGHQYMTYVSRELISISRSLFPLSHRREDTAIYGLSMGGFGALASGLGHPETFGHVGSQSGMVDIGWAIRTRPFMDRKHGRMFGTPADITGTCYDFYDVTRKLSRSDNSKPRIFQSWGQDDYLMEINEAYHRHLAGLDLDYTWHRIPGPHGWGVNGQGLGLFLDWLKCGMEKEGE